MERRAVGVAGLPRGPFVNLPRRAEGYSFAFAKLQYAHKYQYVVAGFTHQGVVDYP